MSANEWADVITKSLQMKQDVIPKGYYPRKEIEKMWKVTKGEANQRLKDMVKQGLVETKKFRVLDARGVCPVQHYKLKCTK